MKKNNLIPPNYFDCNPKNLLRLNDGSLHYFDDEWHAPEPLEIEFVVFRGLLCLYPAYATWISLYWKSFLPENNAVSFMQWSFDQLSLSLEKKESFLNQEAIFQNQILLAKPKMYDVLSIEMNMPKFHKPLVEQFFFDKLENTKPSQKSFMQKVKSKLKHLLS